MFLISGAVGLTNLLRFFCSNTAINTVLLYSTYMLALRVSRSNSKLLVGVSIPGQDHTTDFKVLQRTYILASTDIFGVFLANIAVIHDTVK